MSQPDNHEAQSAAAPAMAGTEKKNWFARHKILTGLGAVIVVAALGSAIGQSNGGGSTGSSGAGSEGAVTETEGETPVEAAESPAAPTGPAVGDTVIDGDFEFVVIAVAEAGTTVGSEYLNETAQGRFVSVQLRVTNVSDSASTFYVDNVELNDAEGRSYSADSMASYYASPDNTLWLTEINPGNSIEGPVLFDLPVAVAPVAVTVSGSLFSNGTEIRLP